MQRSDRPIVPTLARAARLGEGRRRGLLGLMAALALLTAAPLPAQDAVPELEAQVRELVNDVRREQGLKPLTAQPAIADIARAHSRDMAAQGTISHAGFKARFAALREVVPGLRSAAENVAMNAGYADPAEQTVSGWLDSPGHRKNIVGDYASTGVGIVRDADGAVWVTQLYVRAR